jgi:K+-sensing histidine kinase KdpD
MRIRNAAGWAGTSGRRWTNALALTVVAAAIRLTLEPWVHGYLVYAIFTASTALCAYRYGAGPAILCGVVGGLAATYLFVEPLGAFTHPDMADVARLSGYAVINGIFVVLIEKLRRAQYQALLLAEVADSRYHLLLDAVNRNEMLRRRQPDRP